MVKECLPVGLAPDPVFVPTVQCSSPAGCPLGHLVAHVPAVGASWLPGWGLLLWLLPAHSVASPSRFSSAPFERNVTDGVTGMAQGSLGALSEVCNHGLIRADRNVQASPRCEKAREKMANQGTEKQ